MITSFDEMIASVKSRPKKTIAVVMAEDEHVLRAISDAHAEGIADAVLVGNKKNIIDISNKHDIQISHFDIINTTDENQSVVRAIQMVREELVDTLMKGACATATLLKGVLNKEHGIRSGKLLSHVAAFDLPTYDKLLFMSDGGMNIYPDLDAKIAIVDNAVQCAHSFGIEIPKVAVIAAVEKVNHQHMPCTIDAAVLSKMAQRGQIKNCIIDGPLAMDNAISPEACKLKKIDSPVNGQADVLIMPNIETGNVFYKALNYLAVCRTAGVVLGASAPLIVSSRSDSEENKFMSIVMGILSSS